MKFNPKKKEKINIPLRIDEDTVKLIDKLSYKKHMSRNEFLIQCINFALQNLSDENDDTNENKNESK